jgi:hypothetical protein
MESILIHTNNKEEINLLKEIATKMGFKSEVVSTHDKEDIGLAKAIAANNTNDTLLFNDAQAYYQKLDKAK